MRWLATALILLLTVPARSQEGEPGSAARDDSEDSDEAGTAGEAYPRPPAGADRARWLTARIDSIVAGHPELAGVKLGLVVSDLANDQVLAAREGDTALSIASTAKLATAAAALEQLGGATRFESALYAEVRRKSDDPEVVRGDLFFKGGGDPTLGSGDLDELCAQLEHAGIRRIEGGLVIDATRFDGDHLPAAYDDKQDDAPFRAPISAASLDENAVGLWVRPGRADGEPVRFVTTAGGEYVQVVSEALTTEEGKTALKLTSKEVKGSPARLELTLTGTLRLDAEPRLLRKRVPAPETFLGETLREKLEQHGIKLGKARLAMGPTPPRARLLALRVSPPLAVILRDLGKRSDNFVAEMVLRNLAVSDGGPPASSAMALARAHATLARLGWAEGSYRLENGSGLYDASSVSARQLVVLLAAVWRRFAIAPDFVAQLAQAGADGTLARRFADGPGHLLIRAKTGTLDDVIALAGYAGRDGAPPVAFAILLNGTPRGGKRAARAMVDEIAQAIAATAQAR